MKWLTQLVSCYVVTALLSRLNRSRWGKQSDLNPDPFVSRITAVPHLHPCPWPGVCGQPLLCCGPCCRCVCFRDCQTSAAFCREEWRLRSRASSRAGGPLLDGSWMSIWESAETNHTSDLQPIIHRVFTMTTLYLISGTFKLNCFSLMPGHFDNQSACCQSFHTPGLY